MLHKGSPDPMENSSGYVSNTNSMNPPVKYATVGRSRPGGVKRTTSLIVSQPVVPPPKPPPKLAPAPHKEPPRKHYKNDLSRPSSRASRSSANSDHRRPSSRSSRGLSSERFSRHRRSGSRTSYSKVRRPESRTSTSKALILRRRESGRRVASGAQRSSSIRSGRSDDQRNGRPSSRTSQHSQKAVVRREPERSKTSIFSSWKPRLTLRRSTSMQAKSGEAKKREIRFGDERQPEVIMMKGVEHRPRANSESKLRSDSAVKSDRYTNQPVGKRVSQTLNRPANRPANPVPPSRSDRASSVDVSKRLAPVGESAQEDEESPRTPRTRRYQKNESNRNRTISHSPGKQRAPSEASNSRPRAPVWRTDSDGSMSDTLTNRSRSSNMRSEKYSPRDSRSRRSRERDLPPDQHRQQEKSSVLNFLRRTFSIKPKEKPAKPAPRTKRERASSSSVSSLERPVRHSKMKAAKSHELLNYPDEVDYENEKQRYQSLPRQQQMSERHPGRGTTLARRLSSLGWAAAGGRSRPQRSRSFKDEATYEYRSKSTSSNRRSGDEFPRNNERVVSNQYPKDTNEVRRNKYADEDEPIRPILQERRALSHPSLYHPPVEEPSEQPFSHYANLPFQLPPRRKSSPNLLADVDAEERGCEMQPRPSASPRSSSSSGTLRHGGPRRAEKHGDRNKPPAKSILKQQKSDEMKNTNVTREEAMMRKQKSNVFQDIRQNIRNVFRHRKAGEKVPVGDSFVKVSPERDGVVSERFVNVTNTHEETESTREEETVHHLGDAPHQELTRAIRDGVDARELVPADPHAAASGGHQHRVLHQSGRTWRVVDTDDMHETSRRDRHGDLVTESAHTHQREHFQNVQVPDDSSAPEGGAEERRSAQRTRRHTKDVDMLEHFSVPRGGRIGDGIKLGDGMRYVQEDVQESRQGDRDIGDISERMQHMRAIDFRPNGQISIEYRPEEKQRQHTSSWLNNHFGSDSGHSRSSDEDRRRRSGRDERDRDYRSEERYRETSGRRREEGDRRREDRRHESGGRHRETSTYEYQKSSGTTRNGRDPPRSWERSEKYSQEVHETPEKTYVRESRNASHGGRDRSMSGGTRERISDLQSEIDEDPILASKFSSGKRGFQKGGVAFGTYMSPKLNSPSRSSPPRVEGDPPAPPPRTKRKNRLKQTSQSVSPQRPSTLPVDKVYAPDYQPERRKEHRDNHRREKASSETRNGSISRREEFHRSIAPDTVTSHRLEDGSVVKEYHFRSSDSQRDSTPVYREYRESSNSRRDSPTRPARRGSSSQRESPPVTKTYFGQRNRSHSTDGPDDTRTETRHRTTLSTNLGNGNSKRFHHSTDELDRRSVEQPAYRSHTIDRRLGKSAHEAAKQNAFQSQTLPRKPREARDPPSTRIGSRLSSSPRYGGSMINVSVKNKVRNDPMPPPKPDRSPVRRSNSLYSKDSQPPPASAGLKSPNILSQIQRTASMRRASVDGASVAPPVPPPPAAYSPTQPSPPRQYSPPHSSPPARYSPPQRTTPMRAFEAERRHNDENESRISAERTQVIPVSITPPAEDTQQSPRSPVVKTPPTVAPKPSPSVVKKENFMRGLMQTAPELYSALHRDERKDSKTPSPKHSPPLTPPPPLQRARSPMSPQPLPLNYGTIFPKTPPVFKRLEALRADEEVVTKDGRSRSTTPAEDLANFRMGTMSPTGERNDVIKVQR